MTSKFRNTYRISSHRLATWDYSTNGTYFITLVTQNRECSLGQIIHLSDLQQNPSHQIPFVLSNICTIVHNEWLQSFSMRNELYLDNYVFMPNHIHAIVVLNKTENKQVHDMDEMCDSKQTPSSITQYLVRKPQSISSFIAGFKSAVNSKIDDFIDAHNLDIPKYNRNNHFFQPNYHDHIIRNDATYQRINEYITNNPFSWNDDKFNPKK